MSLPVSPPPLRSGHARAVPGGTLQHPPGRNPAAHRAWDSGIGLARAGRLDEAAASLERAIQLAPRVSLYWLNLSSVRRRQHRAEAALVCAQRAYSLDNRSALACQMVAELLRGSHRNAEALETLRSLHPATPRDARHHLLEGATLMAQAQWQEAAQSFLQLLALVPADLDGYTQLGFCLANLRQFTEAAECFRTIALLEPTELGAAVYAAHYSAWACDWPAVVEDEARMVQSLALQQGRERTPAFSPFCLLSMNDDAAMHRQAATLEARRIAREWRAGGAVPWTPPAAGPDGHPLVARRLREGQRMRIGLVSADFRTHATGLLLVQVLELLDRERFEVILYSHGADDGTPLRRRIAAAADRLVECAEMDGTTQAATIRDDGVAVLIDLSGYTQNTRLGVLSLRPAPVQALWLAYPSTTGADFVDYVIGDPVLTPLSHAEDFSECIAQLPVCYEPTDREREHPPIPTREDCGLPADEFVFACFNQNYKIVEPMFTRWCRILHRVPGSVLWLLVPQEDVQRRLADAAAARGIDPARLVFAPFVSTSRHLARLQCADLFLDTFPYGAHTTCSDALWMGLPVLTQVGRSFSGRVAASLLSAVGLPELAAADEHDYETLAVRLAEDPEILAQIREHLREHRLALPLFDSPRFTAELGALLQRMVQRWADGLPPAALPAEPLPAGAALPLPAGDAA